MWIPLCTPLANQGPDLFDVEAVNIKTKARRKIAENQTKHNAEAIMEIAIARRGVDEEFYEIVHSKEAT